MNEAQAVEIARIEERLSAAQAALVVAKIEIDRRLEGMNELRAQIDKERGTFLLRAEYEAKEESIKSQLATLQRFQYMLVGGLLVFQIVLAVLLRLVH